MKIFKYSLFFLLVIILVALPIVQAEAFFGIGAALGAAAGAAAGGTTSSTAGGAVLGGIASTFFGGSSSPPPQPKVVNTWYEDNTDCDCDDYPDIVLGWDYEEEDGNEQEEFEIKVEDEGGAEYFESEQGRADRYYFDEHFKFGLDHEWEVRVKSSEDVWSDWVEGESFATPHRYPEPDFSFSPEDARVDELITFEDESEIFVGDASETYRKWDFGSDVRPKEVIEGYGEEYEEVEIEYKTPENKTATLDVTDSEGRTCSIEKNVDSLKEETPDWQETGF